MSNWAEVEKPCSIDIVLHYWYMIVLLGYLGKWLYQILWTDYIAQSPLKCSQAGYCRTSDMNVNPAVGATSCFLSMSITAAIFLTLHRMNDNQELEQAPEMLTVR